MFICKSICANLILLTAFSASAEPFKKDELPSQCQKKSDNFETSLRCAQDYFSIDGKRINPRIVQDLTTWVSDSGTQVYAISLLESQDSNRYFCNDLSLGVSEENCMTEKGITFDYTLEGKTNNGVFVLTAKSSGGGSGVFYDLLLVRITEAQSIGEIQTATDKNNLNLTPQHKMVLLEKLGSLPLGDRTNPTVKIKDSTIEVENCLNNCNFDNKTSKTTIRLAI